MKLINDEASKPPLVSSNNSAITGSAADRWGWLPAISVTCAFGVFLVALAAEAGRVSSQWADPLFWLGLLALVLPVAVRIISPQPARQERIALLAMLWSMLALFRDLEQPLSFAFNDEFSQWRTAQDIAASGHLFQSNPILTIGPFYPGLQIVTNALSSLTGLSIFVSGMIVLGVAGLMLVLALYLFYEYLGGSAQVAGIATLLYMAKPTFFSDTLFHYEDLAIPLIVFVLFAVVRRSYTPPGRRLGLTLAICLGLAAVVITHHVASYMLVAFLLIWTAAFLLLKIKAAFRRKRAQQIQAGPGWAALLGLLLIAAWLEYTGARAADYLYPSLQTTANQFIQILTGQGGARQVFSNSSGYVEPLWERLTSYASVGLICLGLPFGLFQIWRRHRANAAILAIAVGVLVYPVSLLLRLTHAGVDLGGRTQPYVFGTVAFALALGITHFWLSRFPGLRYRVLLLGAIAIIFLGGWIIGTSPTWNRLPGPYLAVADQRSIQPESVTAAEWAHMNLGPGQRIIGDHYNTLLMGTYGGEWTAVDPLTLTIVFTSPRFDSNVAAFLKLSGIQYLILDRRLELPGIGWYSGTGAPDYSNPTDPRALAKFDAVKNVSRIFDSGNIILYDVQAITNPPSITPTAPKPAPKSLCMPAGPVSGSYPKAAKLYTGTMYDIPTGFTTGISLTGIQQHQGTICGSLAGLPSTPLASGMPTNGPFKGTITTAKEVQFIVTGQTTFSFDGVIQSDGNIAGTYCSLAEVNGKCSDYGLWSVSPAP